MFSISSSPPFRGWKMQASSCTFLSGKPQMPSHVSMIKNPFTLVLDESQRIENQLANGINVKIRSDRPFWLVYYWGANITKFHEKVTNEWKDIKKELLNQSFLEEHSVDHSSLQKFESSDLSHLLKPNFEITSEKLGLAPRACYPLVIFVLLYEPSDENPKLGENSESHSSNFNPTDEVVCLMSIVHIKDSVCPVDTNLISQLAKLKKGRILCIQTLYTPGTDTTDKQSEESARSICVICQDEPIERALLPCRHACVCGECYNLIDKCPLCRSYITSFFEINEAQVIHPEETSKNNPQPGHSEHDNTSKGSSETSLRKRITKFFRPSQWA